jgi:hypothetical protein
MSAKRAWKSLIFAFVAACPTPSLYASIVGFREYHGKTATCIYSGSLGPDYQ